MEERADKGHRDRSVSNAQKHKLRELLLEMCVAQMHLQDIAGSMAEPAHLGRLLYSCSSPSDSSHQDLMSEVVANSCILFSIEDIFNNTQVSTLAQAKDILNVLSEVFQDIALE